MDGAGRTALFFGLIFRQGTLIVIAGMLILVSLIGWLWDRLALGGVEYTRRFAERRAFVGETISLDLSVVNRKALPVGWVRVVDRVPMALPLEGIEVQATDVETVGRVTMVFALRWFERVTRHYTHQLPAPRLLPIWARRVGGRRCFRAV